MNVPRYADQDSGTQPDAAAESTNGLLTILYPALRRVSASERRAICEQAKTLLQRIRAYVAFSWVAAAVGVAIAVLYFADRDRWSGYGWWVIVLAWVNIIVSYVLRRLIITRLVRGQGEA